MVGANVLDAEGAAAIGRWGASAKHGGEEEVREAEHGAAGAEDAILPNTAALKSIRRACEGSGVSR